MTFPESIGIVGGSGQLGGAIARALLRARLIAPERLYISNRSGSTSGFEDWSGINFTTCNQDLADACQIVLLSAPPAMASGIEINAENRLVLSVMAGVTIDRIRDYTGASRIVRAMSNPAANIGLAYSPWCASSGATDADRQWVQTLFDACGLADEVPTEDQIDRFTALTGPVPGFVAYFADCMAGYAKKHGIDPVIADRAVCQLFRASGTVLAGSPASPAEHVGAMIAYAGTTAAGLQALSASPLAAAIEQGLDAAYDRAQSIG